ncbi:hypothetical protein [Bradyrhizobium sp. BR 1432]|uniref:hypothetical protein n=1 Tax=Bradyrhizobium sp. BR 1432 TaxID=3447966 RepID=UPI003EE61F0F
MSRGLGWVQRECLRVIEDCESTGKKATTFTIAAEVYQVRPDKNGNRWIDDAQHVATKRALTNLRRKGLVSGEQIAAVHADGTKIFTMANPANGRTERCSIWKLVTARSE